jgi:hypothetical protein
LDRVEWASVIKEAKAKLRATVLQEEEEDNQLV